MKCNITRTQLCEQLPLDTPLSLHVFPIYHCNFKCSYCLHSLPSAELEKRRFSRQIMKWETFQKAIDDLSQFPGRLKALIFAGHGEPLMHKDIDRMVDYAVKNHVADRVEIVTNGSLLTSTLADRLIAARLSRIRISIQGITSKSYQDVAGVEVDFVKLVENIQYFYRHRLETEVYIKIIDVGLRNEEDERTFHEIFGPVADSAAIEYTIPFVSGMDYSHLKTEFDRCKQGHQRSSEVCSMPFYMLVLEPSGSVVPCCSTSVPIVYGNMHSQALSEIWNGQARKRFLRLQLMDRNRNVVCKECSVPVWGLQEGDYLDAHAGQLLKHYE